MLREQWSKRNSSSCRRNTRGRRDGCPHKETEREQLRMRDLREEREQQEWEQEHPEQDEQLQAGGERGMIRLQEESKHDEQRLLVLCHKMKLGPR